MRDTSRLSRRQAFFGCVFVGLSLLASAALISAGTLAPAPPGVLPFLLLVSLAAPILAAWELPSALAALRRSRDAGDQRDGPPPLDRRALLALRRNLDKLPETRHPLDL